METKIAYFKNKQEEILALHREYSEAKERTEREANDYIEGKKKELLPYEQQLSDAKAKYCAELKSEYGITDGESANVLQLVELIYKIKVGV